MGRGKRGGRKRARGRDREGRGDGRIWRGERGGVRGTRYYPNFSVNLSTRDHFGLNLPIVDIQLAALPRYCESGGRGV